MGENFILKKTVKSIAVSKKNLNIDGSKTYL